MSQKNQMPNVNYFYALIGYMSGVLLVTIMLYFFNSQTNTLNIENSLATAEVSFQILQNIIHDNRSNTDTVVNNLQGMHEYFISGKNPSLWWNFLIEKSPIGVHCYEQWCVDVVSYQRFALLPEHIAQVNELIEAFQKVIAKNEILGD